MSSAPTRTTVLGLGVMGSALAGVLIDAGHPTTVWNRSPAMTGGFTSLSATIDARDYAGEGQQSLGFSDLTKLVTATVEQGVSAEVLQPVHAMIQRQIAAGHGDEGFARIFEELRTTR
jgi:3-hydroxyisobutyrate dehydrogenase-like beta-hydroxyacid dehydrogenase